MKKRYFALELDTETLADVICTSGETDGTDGDITETGKTPFPNSGSAAEVMFDLG